MPRDTQVGPISSRDEAEAFDSHVSTSRDWLNPISMDRLQQAVKKKADTVVLADGTSSSTGIARRILSRRKQ
jgi:hypothetical protein